MSERRQLALLLLGVVALAGVGIGGATLFPEPCEGLELRGELPLAFTDAVDALPVDGGVGTSLEALGADLGIGPWRGAVALPAEAWVSPSEFGFFVVSDDAFTVLRPSMGIASAARGRSGLDVVPAGTSLALRTDGGETGIFNGEFELDRCGELPPDADVLALAGGLAVVADGSEVGLVTLSGDAPWRAPAVAAAHLTTTTVVLVDDGLLEVRDARDGEVLGQRELDTEGPGGQDLDTSGPLLWSAGDRLLVREGPTLLSVGADAAALGTAAPVALALPPDTPIRDAVGTPAGVVALAGAGQQSLVTSDRATAPVQLPDGVTGLQLEASRDGHVGLVVEVDGQQVLLVYGPDA